MAERKLTVRDIAAICHAARSELLLVADPGAEVTAFDNLDLLVYTVGKAND